MCVWLYYISMHFFSLFFLLPAYSVHFLLYIIRYMKTFYVEKCMKSNFFSVKYLNFLINNLLFKRKSVLLQTNSYSDYDNKVKKIKYNTIMMNSFVSTAWWWRNSRFKKSWVANPCMDMNPKILRACRNLRQVLFLYSKVLYRIFQIVSINIK